MNVFNTYTDLLSSLKGKPVQNSNKLKEHTLTDTTLIVIWLSNDLFARWNERVSFRKRKGRKGWGSWGDGMEGCRVRDGRV